MSKSECRAARSGEERSDEQKVTLVFVVDDMVRSVPTSFRISIRSCNMRSIASLQPSPWG